MATLRSTLFLACFRLTTCDGDPFHDARAVSERHIDARQLKESMTNLEFQLPLAELMDEGQPVALRGFGAALEWTALDDDAWNRSFLKQEMPELKVHVSRAPTSRLHSAAHPLSAGQVDNVTWHRPYAEEVVRTTAFLNGHSRVRFDDYSSPYLSAMIPFQNLTAGMKRTLGGNTHLLSNGFRPIMEMNVWWTRNGLCTPSHYDGVHNAYVQVKGMKRFVLHPSSAWKGLYLFPKLHPSSRQSAADWARHQEDGFDAMFPNFRKLVEDGSAMQVTLEPGDVLYIPPYTFHQVCSVPDDAEVPVVSMSVSTHTESVNVDILEGTSSLGAPIWGGMTQSQRVAILKMYCSEVITSLANLEAAESTKHDTNDGVDNGGEWNPQSFARALLEARYDHLNADEGVGVSGLVSAIDRASEQFVTTTFVPPAPSAEIVKVVNRRVQQFASWRRQRIVVEQAAWELILMDYIEDVSSSALGPFSVRAFLAYLAGELELSDAPEPGIVVLSHIPAVEGGTDPPLNLGDTVSIHYEARFSSSSMDSEPFDSSRPWVGASGAVDGLEAEGRMESAIVDEEGRVLDPEFFQGSDDTGGDASDEHKPFTFKLGAHSVIAGLETAVLEHMRRPGDRITAMMPSGTAYGSLGAGDGVVPPYTDLVFEIELMKVTRSP